MIIQKDALKMERLNRIILSGFKQSLQAFLPQINEPVSLDDFLKKNTCDHAYYGDCLASTRNDFHHIVPEKATLIIIVPEGDFQQESETYLCNITLNRYL